MRCRWAFEPTAPKEVTLMVAQVRRALHRGLYGQKSGKAAMQDRARSWLGRPGALGVVIHVAIAMGVLQRGSKAAQGPVPASRSVFVRAHTAQGTSCAVVGMADKFPLALSPSATRDTF